MSHEAFDLIEQRFVDTLNFTASKYVHRKTGAEHLHFDTDHDENVFLVALRTMPEDSSGVAHILEHTALCGSERYPVRDPFFLMIRRSLNTFMNAFTGSDYTAYPFASQNRKDFFNLMDIYLDAVFFSRLDPLDFAQEGHRLEFIEPTDTSSDLVYKGIVFNEMKGDTSSPMSRLYSKIQYHLFPTTTYHFNSGGDPKDIPSLEYDDLKAFYASHYHPSNAVFMTFGNIPVTETQLFFEDRALSRFDKREGSISVGPEKRYTSPIRAVESYPETELEGHTHIVVAWLLKENTDLMMLLKCHLLSDVLLDTSASPLRKALEDSDLGRAISPLTGLEENNHEMSFMCGFEGGEADSEAAVQELILDTLAKVAEEGVSITQLESVLHQLELSQREIGGDGSPYGLQVMFSCLSAAIHRGDPLSLLDLDSAIEKLREEITDPQFICRLIQELLLDNPHRVTLVMAPDPDMAAREAGEERTRLAEIKNSLNEQDLARIIDQTDELVSRQSRDEDLSVLPKVGLEDIGPARNDPVGVSADSETPLTSFQVGTNGITYQQVITQLPELSSEQVLMLPLYTALITELGSAARGYIETQLLQQAVTGGINAFSTVRTDRDDLQHYGAYCTVSSKTLTSKVRDMVVLLRDTAMSPNFDETARIRDLIKQFRVRRDAGITGNGHMLAMSAAAAGLRPVTALNHELAGIGGLIRLRELDNALDDDEVMEKLQTSLRDLHTRLIDGQKQLVLITDPVSHEMTTELVRSSWTDSVRNDSGFSIETPDFSSDTAFITNTQVNFCAKVFPTVPESHEDSPVMSVLAGILRNGYLHPVIREQGGAYGGGAMHDNANGVFRFYSYRDPNLMSTFAAFDDSLEWLKNSPIRSELIEEAILGIIGSLDAPGSPAGEARQCFYHQLFGRSEESRQKFRDGVLSTDVDAVMCAAETYFGQEYRRAVITSPLKQAELTVDFDQFEL